MKIMVWRGQTTCTIFLRPFSNDNIFYIFKNKHFFFTANSDII